MILSPCCSASLQPVIIDDRPAYNQCSRCFSKVEISSPEKPDFSGVSDGYHTFAELYQHRSTLFIALCRELDNAWVPVWRSKLHSDGTMYPEMFILGIYKEPGKQITYHLEKEYWDETEFAETLDQAPEWDCHTSGDVLYRLKQGPL